MRPGLGEAKALEGAAGEATSPVTALPGWAAPTRAARERAEYVSLEPWRSQPLGQRQLGAPEEWPTDRTQWWD